MAKETVPVPEEEVVPDPWECSVCQGSVGDQYLFCPTCGNPRSSEDVPAALDSDVTSDSPEMPETPASGTEPQAPKEGEGNAKSK